VKEEGTPELRMKAPITCPTESIPYRIDLGLGQFFEIEWRLTKLPTSQSAPEVGGAGGSGLTNTSTIHTQIGWDLATGDVTLSWDATSAGESYSIEASEDLITWAEIGNVTSTSADTASFVDTTPFSISNVRFYRIRLIIP
jgi:hypothetical protein